MRAAVTLVVIAGCSAWLGGGATGLAAEPGHASGKSRSAYQEMRNPQPAARVETVLGWQDLPPAEAARLVVKFGLTDRAPEVRQTAYDVLWGVRNDQAAAELLLKSFDAESHNAAGGQVAGPILAVLAANESADVQRELAKTVDAAVARSKAGIPLVIIAAEQMQRQGDAAAVAALEHMTHWKCCADIFACRRAVVQALVHMRCVEAVDLLVALLPQATGEVRGDILGRLGSLTDEQLGVDPQAWQTWWQAHKDGFRFPDKPAAQRQMLMPGPDLPSYYGLQICARRMVFVIDISGSMTGQRIDTAKRELTNALGALAEDAQFGLIVFNNAVTVWRPQLVPATPNNKQAAYQFVLQLAASGSTAASDALDAAANFDAEAIYFLTDGAPTSGKIVDPVKIVAAVTRANRFRLMSIYAIGIAPGQPGGSLDTFLKNLAELNLGVYRRVDQ